MRYMKYLGGRNPIADARVSFLGSPVASSNIVLPVSSLTNGDCSICPWTLTLPTFRFVPLSVTASSSQGASNSEMNSQFSTDYS